ncbi:MAG: hypothetical protein CMJ83_08480 [Planctomycetes bacterium]|nr:hypothetical protein [Planctomycetota bacterium]
MTSIALRAVCLLSCLILTAVPTLAQGDPDEGIGDRPAGQPTPGVRPGHAARLQPIQKPTDPNKVRGSYTVAGETKTLIEGDFYAAYLCLKPHEEKPNRPLQPQRILEHVLLFAEATSMGFALDDTEKDLVNPIKTNKQFESMLRKRLEQQGISEEQYVRYIAETRAIQRMKNWYANSVRVRSSEVYDLWKRDNFLYRVAYLDFSAADLIPKLKEKPPTPEQLEQFWSTNPQVQNKYRNPTSVTADLVIFDPTSVTEEEIARLKGSRKIERAEALEHFIANRDRLVKQIPSDKRPQLYPRKDKKVSIEKLVTPFMLLRSQIDREILVGDRISTAFKAAATTTNSADIEALAKTNKLQHIRLKKASRQEVATEHAKLGPTLFTDLFNATPGALGTEVRFFGPLQFFWRLEDKSVSSLPPFDDVADKITDDWYEFEAYHRSQASAKAFLEKVDAKVREQTKERETALDAQAVIDGENEIRSSGTKDERQKEAIRQKHRTLADHGKRKLRSEIMPEHFDSVVAAEGLKLKEVGPFSFSFAQRNRTEISDPTKRAEAFLTSSYQIKALGPGFVSPILSDIVSRTHYIAKVLTKQEPPFESMSTVDYHQRKMAAERQAMFTSNYMWTLFQVQRRLGWKDK